jgi:hypothetical protein
VLCWEKKINQILKTLKLKTNRDCNQHSLKFANAWWVEVIGHLAIYAHILYSWKCSHTVFVAYFDLVFNDVRDMWNKRSHFQPLRPKWKRRWRQILHKKCKKSFFQNIWRTNSSFLFFVILHYLLPTESLILSRI